MDGHLSKRMRGDAPEARRLEAWGLRLGQSQNLHLYHKGTKNTKGTKKRRLKAEAISLKSEERWKRIGT